MACSVVLGLVRHGADDLEARPRALRDVERAMDLFHAGCAAA
ncbi:hypothetical protein [Actinacidiphila yeochonensis]|nr:hypothetical protein [Actinacidiphila yeochonensis]